MKIAVCDDNKGDLLRMQSHIRQYRECERVPLEVFAYTDSRDLLGDYEQRRFQVIFLDIYMREPNGLEAARLLRKKDERLLFIFTTISLEHPLQAFGVSATDYLVKPISYEPVVAALEKCRCILGTEAQYMTVTIKRMLRHILLRDIFWTESRGRITVLHTREGVLETYLAYSELVELLAGRPFLSCCRGYLVNVTCVEAVLEDDFLLKNGEKVPIRRRGANEVKQAFYDYLWKKTRKEI